MGVVRSGRLGVRFKTVIHSGAGVRARIFMKLFVYAFICMFVLAASNPLFAQESDADTKMIEQMPADEEGFSTAPDDEPVEMDAPEDDAAAQSEQNPHDALRMPKVAK